LTPEEATEKILDVIYAIKALNILMEEKLTKKSLKVEECINIASKIVGELDRVQQEIRELLSNFSGDYMRSTIAESIYNHEVVGSLWEKAKQLLELCNFPSYLLKCIKPKEPSQTLVDSDGDIYKGGLKELSSIITNVKLGFKYFLKLRGVGVGEETETFTG